jgi:hypothetical protein
MSEKNFLCKSLLFNGLWIYWGKSENNSLPFKPNLLSLWRSLNFTGLAKRA